MGAGGLEGRAEEAGDLPDDTAAEGEDADHEDHALDDGDPGAELGEVVLEGDYGEGADDGAEDGAEAAEERHQDNLARHGPLHVGEGCELEYDGLGPASPERVAESTKATSL